MNTLWRLLILMAVAAAMLLPKDSPRAQEAERILSFHSDVVIHQDSSMTVTETITVVAQGVQIRRGIYRDFPTRYWDNSGHLYTVGFHVNEVLRDGQPEPYHFGTLFNGRRVYIGQEDVYLQRGEYTYTLTYDTNMQLGFFTSFDELYWNVTGNGWDFPIERASATITLPGQVSAADVVLEAYTGYQGEQDQFYDARFTGEQAEFTTNLPLAAGQGLTIVMRFPKGIVTPPAGLTGLRFWRANHPAAVLGVAGLVVILLFYLIAWLLAGVDPRRGEVVPQDVVPGDLSPALLRHLRRMGSDYTAFTATLVELAAKGLVRIEVDAAGNNTVVHTGKADAELSPEQQALMARLFAKGTEVLIDQDNHLTLSGSYMAMNSSLEQQCRGTYYYRNKPVTGIGWLLTFLVLVGMGLLSGDKFIFFFCTVFIVGLAYFAMNLAIAAVSGQTVVMSVGGTGGRVAAGVGAVVLFVLTLVPTIVLGLFSSPGTALAPLGLALVGSIFGWLMPRYTRRGRELLDQIAGYRLTLAGQGAGIPGGSAANGEAAFAFLPYAIALDIHRQWARQLEQLFARSARPPAPEWYRNPYERDFRHESFTSSMASSFTSSVASSSVAPGSSSGGGGGGSSGGGGGGGGGGGW